MKFGLGRSDTLTFYSSNIAAVALSGHQLLSCAILLLSIVCFTASLLRKPVEDHPSWVNQGISPSTTGLAMMILRREAC